MTALLPQEKRTSVRSQLQNIVIQTKVTFKQMQELTGLLTFCVRAIHAVRAFIHVRQLYDASCGLRKCFLIARVTPALALVKYLGLIGRTCGLNHFLIHNFFGACFNSNGFAV